ncbi:hypothetical protein APA_2666 [Pseudanabaena sp. lw0831]|nr:hypothetical protein APA_2666 [Pseudanabaena sp. lw0831]
MRIGITPTDRDVNNFFEIDSKEQSKMIFEKCVLLKNLKSL